MISCQSENHVHEEIMAEQAQQKAGDLELSNVVIGDVEYGWFEETIEANGTVELPPAGRRKMTQIHGGYVTSTDLLPGQEVRKGQVLCRIKNPVFVELQKDFLSAKARGVYLGQDLERKSILVEKQGVSRKDYQKAKAEFEENRAILAGLKAQLSLIGVNAKNLTLEDIRSTISMRAPFNGFVTNVHINPGQYVGPTDVLFELIDTDHLHVHLDVFERNVALLKKGQKVRLFSSSSPKENCEGSIFLIDRSLNANSVMGVHVDLEEDHKDHLNLGMYVQGEIVVKSDSAWIVPGEALVRDGEGNEGLLIEKNGGFEWIKVNVIGQNADVVAISAFWDSAPPKVVLENAYKVFASLQEEENMDMGHSH